MKIYFLIVCLFLALPLTGCYSQTKEESAEAIRAGDTYSWDFGRVKEGVVPEHEFILKNESAKTINIKDITTSCGCTASQAGKKTLLPQESTTIEVKFDTKGYFGPTKQFVYVNTDDPVNPVVKFTVKAEVVK